MFDNEWKTTCLSDLRIAVAFGESAISDTYERLYNMFKDDWRGMAELTIATNWLCWHFFEEGNMDLSDYFKKLFVDAQDFSYEHFAGEELINYWLLCD